MSCMVFIDLYWSMQSRGLFYTITYKPYNTWGHYHVDKKKPASSVFMQHVQTISDLAQFLMKNSALLQYFF